MTRALLLLLAVTACAKVAETNGEWPVALCGAARPMVCEVSIRRCSTGLMPQQSGEWASERGVYRLKPTPTLDSEIVLGGFNAPGALIADLDAPGVSNVCGVVVGCHPEPMRIDDPSKLVEVKVHRRAADGGTR